MAGGLLSVSFSVLWRGSAWSGSPVSALVIPCGRPSWSGWKVGCPCLSAGLIALWFTCHSGRVQDAPRWLSGTISLRTRHPEAAPSPSAAGPRPPSPHEHLPVRGGLVWACHTRGLSLRALLCLAPSLRVRARGLSPGPQVGALLQLGAGDAPIHGGHRSSVQLRMQTFRCPVTLQRTLDLRVLGRDLGTLLPRASAYGFCVDMWVHFFWVCVELWTRWLVRTPVIRCRNRWAARCRGGPESQSHGLACARCWCPAHAIPVSLMTNPVSCSLVLGGHGRVVSVGRSARPARVVWLGCVSLSPPAQATGTHPCLFSHTRLAEACPWLRFLKRL